jgi:hypothetical protein
MWKQVINDNPEVRAALLVLREHGVFASLQQTSVPCEDAPCHVTHLSFLQPVSTPTLNADFAHLQW